jgi:hypothetical protein
MTRNNIYYVAKDNPGEKAIHRPAVKLEPYEIEVLAEDHSKANRPLAVNANLALPDQLAAKALAPDLRPKHANPADPA